MKKLLVLSVFLSLILPLSWAQGQDSLDKIEVKTYTRYSPVLTSARKLPTVPVFETPKAQLPTFTYELPDFRYAVDPTYLPAKAVAVKTDRDQDLNDNYFKFGGGNFLTGLAEIHLHNTENKKYDFGGFARHLSSNASDPANADFSDNQLGIFGTQNSSKGKLSGQLNFERHVLHYYGVTDTSLEFNKRQSNQIFNDLNGRVAWNSNPSKKGVGFASAFDFYTFSSLRQNENDFQVTLNPFYEMKRKGRFDLLAKIDYTTLKHGAGSLNRTFIHVNPFYNFTLKKFDITAGLNTVYSIDSSEGNFLVFPDIKVKHYIVPKRLKAFVELTGGIQKNQFRTLAYINPFINYGAEVKQTINQLDFTAGLKGTLSKKVDYLVQINYLNQKDLPLYLADSGVFNRFNTVYDKVGTFSFKTGLGVRINEQFFIQWAGTFYNYSVDIESNPWQLPDYDIDLNLRYTIGKKLKLRAQAYIMGERFQKNFATDKIVKLKPIGDINIMAEYRYKDNLAFFLNVNNLSNTRYQKWYNYPSYGINVLGGLSFSL